MIGSGAIIGVFLLLIAIFAVVGYQAGIFDAMFAADGAPGPAGCHLTSAPTLREGM